MPVLFIAAISLAAAYSITLYPWPFEKVASTPPVATPAIAEKVTPAPFVTPPQATLPAQTSAPTAAPAVQDVPQPARRPARFTGMKKKKSGRH